MPANIRQVGELPHANAESNHAFEKSLPAQSSLRTEHLRNASLSAADPILQWQEYVGNDGMRVEQPGFH
jgi:hypothetical protein